MSGIAILSALASTVRPTSLAAVTALLVSKRPKRLLLAYILTGFVVSVVIGVLVVTLLHQLATKHHKSHAWFELWLGVIALAGATLVVIRERRHRENRRNTENGERKPQVLVYNLIWFAMPIAALILSMVDLEDTQTRIESVASWTRRHERVIGSLLLAAVGVYLVIKALVNLM